MAPQGETFCTFAGALVGAVGPLDVPKAVLLCVPVAMWAGGFIGLSFWRWVSRRN